jgi:hypothetical protein
VFRNQKTVMNPISRELSGNEFIRNLESNNLSSKNFYIRKAEVEIKKGDERERFLVSWKYEVGSKSLFSIRTRAGLEVSRVFLTADTIIINDRINRIVYSGKPLFLRRKYGLPQELVLAVVGDYIRGSGQMPAELKCIGGSVNLGTSVKGVKTEYVVDCRKGKIAETAVFDGEGRKALEMRFGDFESRNGEIAASRILIKYYDMDAEINIKVDKIEYPWEGMVTFIPGKGYDKKSLD